MDDISKKLETIYSRLRELKQTGIKMKDIAETIQFPPSVLSALYATVLPSYLRNIQENSHDEALDYAISQVNNVSKKRLLTNIDSVYTRLVNFQKMHQNGKSKIPYIEQLIREINHREVISRHIEGVYLSYSQSSAAREMIKIEPFLLKCSEDQKNLTVVRTNTAGKQHEGFGIYKEHQALYLQLNESNTETFFAPVSITLKLSFVEDFTLLRGIYTCFDVNKNPIARRIILHKISDSTDPTVFMKEKPHLQHVSSLEGDMRLFADYTCHAEDALKLCSFPSLGSDISALAKEKDILAILDR